MATISIEVERDVAEAFQRASLDERQKLEMLLGLRLKELTEPATQTLRELMDEVGAEAEVNGLTEQQLESLLDGE